jgi:putative heme-binding domain-containing protein
LIKRLGDPDAAVRRTAATALGRIGDPAAVPSLVRAIDETIDRGEDHAITYALIEIGSVAAIQNALATLTDTSALQRRAMMIVIDQIDHAAVDPEIVFPGLEAAETSCRSTAIDIIRRHPEWSDRAAAWIRLRMDQADGLSDADAAAVQSLLTALIDAEPIRGFVTESLSGGDPVKVRTALAAIARAGSVRPDPQWSAPLTRLLADADDDEVRRTIVAICSLTGNDFLPLLRTITVDPSRSSVTRLAAVSAVTRRLGVIDEPTFRLLSDWCVDSELPAAADLAAQAIGSAGLTDPQRLAVTKLLPHASPARLRSLLPAFSRTRDPDVIAAFLSAVASADALLSLSESELSEVVKRYPPSTLDEANELLGRLRTHQRTKQLMIDRLRSQVEGADAGRGKLVFRSEKAKCIGCHRVGELGQRVGPDLTTIGINRSTDDLLESIVFPSASIVRDYETYKAMMVDGRVISGVRLSETSDQIILQPTSGEPVTLSRDAIEVIVPHAISIMPSGLDESLTASELLDLVAYLKSLR